MPNATFLAGNGANTIVAAITGKVIRVHSLVISNSTTTATSAIWKSGSTSIGGVQYYGSNAERPTVYPHNPDGWFETAAGEALVLTLEAARPHTGHLMYSVIG